jgi:hypothetical protein
VDVVGEQTLWIATGAAVSTSGLFCGFQNGVIQPRQLI